MSYFNAKEETSTLDDRSIFQAGLYDMIVTDIGEKADKYNNEYISVEFTVSEGPSKNRKLWENLYLHSEHEGVERKGRAILKALCDACEIASLSGPSDLKKFIGAEFIVKLGVYKNKDTGVERNIINSIKGKATEQTEPKPKAKAPIAKPKPVKQTTEESATTEEDEDQDVPF